jgi:uncharacterized protein YjbI with pentapeptide repeats
MAQRMTWVAQSAAELDALVVTLSGLRARFGLRLLALSLPPGAWVLHIEGVRLAEVHAALQLPLALGQNRTATSGLALRVLSPPGSAALAAIPTATSPPATSPGNPSVSTGMMAPVSPDEFRGKDWRGRDFSGSDLRGADFSEADLRGANFSRANLTGACFRAARFGAQEEAHGMNRARRMVHVRGSVAISRVLLPLVLLLFGLLIGSGMLGAGNARYAVQVLQVLLMGLILPALWLLQLIHSENAKVRWLVAAGSNFAAANLLGADFSDAKLGLANFAGANLRHVRWHGAQQQEVVYFDPGPLRENGIWPLLTATRGKRQDFAALDLSWQDLSGLDLSGCNLQGGDLRHANLVGTNLQRAQLQRADCRAANLQQADLSGADLSGTLIDATTLHQGLRCHDWRASNLPGGRWPPLPHPLRAGELMQHLASLLPGVVFVATSLPDLWRWLWALESQAGVRGVQQIRVQYPADPTAEPAFEIDVVLASEQDVSRLCHQVWQAQRQLASAPPDARLLALFQALVQEPVLVQG